EADLQVRLAQLVLRQRPDAAEDPLLGMLADGAGVEQDDVRLARLARRRISRARPVPAHQPGVGQGHLAGGCFNVGRRHATATYTPGRAQWTGRGAGPPCASVASVVGLMRIASLLPSATEIVCALGLADQLVGVSHECDFPPEIVGRPVLTAPKIDPRG